MTTKIAAAYPSGAEINALMERLFGARQHNIAQGCGRVDKGGCLEHSRG